MILTQPKCCGECFFINNINNVSRCSNVLLSTMPETNAYIATTVNPSTVPDWCPISKTNEIFDTLSPEQQEAFNNICKGMQFLFGWKNSD